MGNPRFPSLLYKTLTLVKVKYWVFYRFTADKQIELQTQIVLHDITLGNASTETLIRQ